MVTVIVLAVLAVWVAWAIRGAKKNKCSCGGDCARCAGSCKRP